MKKQIFFAFAAALTFSHAMAAVCPAGTSAAVVERDTVGAISLDVLQHLDFKSQQAVNDAVANHTAQPIAGGAVVCTINGHDGFFDHAAHVKIPGRSLDLWIGDAESTLKAPD